MLRTPEEKFRVVSVERLIGSLRRADHTILGKVVFHDGRATFATWATSPGPDGAPRLDVMVIARQTGHKNLKMSMRYYRPSVESFVERLNA